MGIVLLSILSSAAVITWAPLHSLGDEARVIARAPGGDWVWKGKSPFALGLRVDQSTGKTEYSSSTTSSVSLGPFACERVWILALSGGRLTQETGLALQEALLVDPVLTESAYFPLSDQPLAIERPPDLYVTIEVLRHSQTRFPGYQRLAFDLRWTVGRRPFRTRLSLKRSEERAPFATGVVHHEEQGWGLVSAATAYDDAVEAVTRAIDLPDRIATARTDLGRLASVPLEHAGASHEPADLPFLGEPGLRRLYSATPFLTHGEDAWLLPSADPVARLGPLLETLGREGWSVVRQGPWAFLVSHGTRTLEVGLKFGAVRGEESQSLGFFQQDRFTTDEIRAFFEARVTAGDGPQDLELLVRHMLSADREDLAATLEASAKPGNAALVEALLVSR